MLPFTRRNATLRRMAALQPCPLPVELDLSQARRVLVFAPHPDDETLGCGGTLARLSAQCAIKVVLVTDGSGAGGLPAGAAQTRQQEFARALGLLGVVDWECLQQPDGDFRANSALAQRVQEILHAHQPNWVFLPSPLDYHRDHIRISDFVEAICRKVAGIEQLLFYEIWAPVPATHVVDITEQAVRKQAALLEHVTALAHGDYVRAAQGLAQYRGLYLGVNRMAEAFYVEAVKRPGAFKKLQSVGLDILERIVDLRHPPA